MIAAASRVRSALGLTALAVALGLAGCGDLLQEPDTGVVLAGLRLQAISGNAQAGSPGSALEDPVRVRVLDGSDRPLAGLWVEWSVVEGAGRVEPRHSFSDADGIAEATWILGPSTGSQTVQAFAGRGAVVTFEATAGGL
jgi:hypothetical protein